MNLPPRLPTAKNRVLPPAPVPAPPPPPPAATPYASRGIPGTAAGYAPAQTQAQAQPARQAGGDGYQPENPLFFLRAVASLVGALVVPSGILDEADQRLALGSAEAVAQLLDGGIVPEGYTTPENFALITRTLTYEHKNLKGEPLSNANGNASEGIKAVRHEQMMKHEAMRLEQEQRKKTAPTLSAQAGPSSIQPVRAVEEIRKENAAQIALLADISDPVRDAALAAIVSRLGAMGKTITGYDRDAVLGVAIAEILRAIQLAERYGVPARGYATVQAQFQNGEIDAEQASRVCPYPASLSLELSVAVLHAEIDRAQEGTPADQGAAGESNATDGGAS